MACHVSDYVTGHVAAHRPEASQREQDSAETLLANSNTRVQVHRAVQLISSLLVTVGFILPFTSFVAYEEQHGAKEAGLTSIHKALGITIMSGLGCHILLTLLRPKPDHERRWVWNLAHWWLGRGVWALALANVGIGIALWRRATGGSGAEWIIPLVALALGYFVLHLFLVRKGRLAAQYESPSGGLAKGLPSSSEMAQVREAAYA